IGSHNHRALLYSIKVKIGGITGVIASLMGKKPPDTQAWVLTGEAPAFARADGPLFGDGAIFRMEVAVPAVWPDSGSLRTKKDSTMSSTSARRELEKTHSPSLISGGPTFAGILTSHPFRNITVTKTLTAGSQCGEPLEATTFESLSFS